MRRHSAFGTTLQIGSVRGQLVWQLHSRICICPVGKNAEILVGVTWCPVINYIRYTNPL